MLMVSQSCADAPVDEDFHRLCDPLLSAFDQVANSNSHLLVTVAAEGSLQRRFLKFVRGRSFRKQMFESDRRRGWDNFQTYDRQGRQIQRQGGFYNGGHISFDDNLSAPAFTERLVMLLEQGPCWYGRRLPAGRAAAVVGDFVGAFPVDDDQVLAVRPDFLFSHDYLGYQGGTPDNPRAMSYFDGCGADHCWTWLSGGRLLMLLLNGCS